jgi:hypothetical protein
MSDEPLYCLNTSDNKIVVDGHEFLDYDETSEGDRDTMNYIEGKVNAMFIDKTHKFTEYCPAFDENIIIKTTTGYKPAKDIKIGDKLVTGGEVVGLIRRKADEMCKLEDGTIMTPSTLCWNPDKNNWSRVGENREFTKQENELVSFIVVPNSQIEFANGLRVRDYMELCSPDSEMYYSKRLEQAETKLIR